ncbi:branched-chain amino acid ABC transporter permease [Metallumcola ferriviriculae]|uniref:Branched-chain amino acid ABC transporter permease n=1 Tax=Metallumcola ferriviriculae TaxID=3039180 RepID=A0AAU0UKF7_9FIRM|nr:branched-chain amino acid ABC transporter permease [Desulfitibacteraceae bacterium MK1]
MEQNVIFQLLVNALQLGGVYVMFTLGLTLIFGIMSVVNFAHGEIFTLAAYLTIVFYEGISSVGLNSYTAYVLVLVLVALTIALVSWVMERVIFRPFSGDLVSGLIVSLGLSLALQAIFLLTFGAEPLSMASVFNGIVTLFGGIISREKLVIVLFSLIITFVVYALVQRTRLGMAMRAITQNKEAAQLQGVNYNKISIAGFVLGGVLAAIAGVLVVPAALATPHIGAGYLMKAFIIIIIGGMGSIPGTIIAGFLLGFIESITSFYFSLQASSMLLFALVIVILIVRPKGLLGYE